MAQPWKHPSSGLFYIRRRVPDELRPVLGLEYKRSLKTREPGKAKALFAAAWVRSEEVFSAARAQVAGLPALTARDVQQLAARWFRQELEEMERTGEFRSYLIPGQHLINEGPDGHIEYQEWESLSSAPEHGIDIDRSEFVSSHVLRMLQAEGIPLPAANSPELVGLVDAFWVHCLKLSDLAKRRYDGDWLTRPEIMPVEALSFRAAATAPSMGKTLLESFSAYSAAKLLDDGENRSTLRTLADFRGTIDRFVQLFGDLRVKDISRSVVQEYRSKLAGFPKKFPGSGEMLAPDLIARAQAEKLPTLAQATIRNRLRALGAVMGYAHRMGWVSENPVDASGVAKAAGKAQGAVVRKKRDYSEAELKQIFQSALFTAEGVDSSRQVYGRAMYWLPLLMYYTGARREELCQLAVRDVLPGAPSEGGADGAPEGAEGAICAEAGIPYISILEGLEGESEGLPDGRTVKTAGSRRRIPLHPDLLRLGFLEYARGLPCKGQLFPMLKPNPAGFYGANIGKAWSKYLRDVVRLNTTASPSHGFRHTFKTLSRKVGISEDVHDALTGHTNGHVGRDYGSMPLSRIIEELKKYPSAPLLE
ncbi:DUF6538 domain-containing protein [Pseudomonas sp. PDM16]|uniref:DUF6538 domain-containing protein n=1 Tax=Pseudomonas sp. PDM16 TaxID=2769292 RepID=UPI00298C5143|nr:DUF6538 domain-containing protein [Pseudomonas sp. PDM16]